MFEHLFSSNVQQQVYDPKEGNIKQTELFFNSEIKNLNNWINMKRIQIPLGHFLEVYFKVTVKMCPNVWISQVMRNIDNIWYFGCFSKDFA